eukprot:gene15980-biopygen9721
MSGQYRGKPVPGLAAMTQSPASTDTVASTKRDSQNRSGRRRVATGTASPTANAVTSAQWNTWMAGHIPRATPCTPKRDATGSIEAENGTITFFRRRSSHLH